MKIIVILGPTATGKSDLAVQIATKVGGEVISADSRQVYTGLNIGTGKITKREMRDIPHHLLDIISPKKVFSVAEWQKMTKKKIVEIIARGHVPIIVGGTGFYIQSIVDDIVLPEVPPNKVLRKKLEKKSAAELFEMLRSMDPRRARGMIAENSDKNPVRLIRAIEIATKLGRVPELAGHQVSGKSEYKFLQIGLTTDPEILKKRIHTRLLKRMKQGMVSEARKLHTNGLSYKRMRALGLEYRHLADFLENNLTKDELIGKLDQEIYQYAKRQITWFKRDARIQWFNVGSPAQSRAICGKVLKLYSE